MYTVTFRIECRETREVWELSFPQLTTPLGDRSVWLKLSRAVANMYNMYFSFNAYLFYNGGLVNQATGLMVGDLEDLYL